MTRFAPPLLGAILLLAACASHQGSLRAAAIGPATDIVALKPIFAGRFACIEHPPGELPYLGDDLGTDCFILGWDDERPFIRPFRTDGRTNEDWYGWGQPVLSPVAGTVRDVIPGRGTNRPGEPGMPPASIIEIAVPDGTIVSLAHVEAITVRRGDTVAAGQQLGTVGNNGFSRAPHIHVGAWRKKQPLQVRWLLPPVKHSTVPEDP